MDSIRIRGGTPLHGQIAISGAKNAVLPLMVTALLTDQPVILHKVPALTDIKILGQILAGLGCQISTRSVDIDDKSDNTTMELHCPSITSDVAPYRLVSTMRASFWVLAPLLARHGSARISLPGGCALGPRPVDFILDALLKMGAMIDLDEGYVIARAPATGLKAATFCLPRKSVGTTHMLMMAATLANGTTRIENAACEPEISDVAACLNAMGARIAGAGSETITIEGVARLSGTTHHAMADRIEAATYAFAVAMTGGTLTLNDAPINAMQATIDVLRHLGLEVAIRESKLILRHDGSRLRAHNIVTDSYPGFATDLQAQFMAAMTLADGESRIHETIFENRFMHVNELQRLGADIRVAGDTAYVKGVAGLRGAPVMATDLRASACLILAGLAAQGETFINRVYHLDRGFAAIERKLVACGAQIDRLRNPQP